MDERKVITNTEEENRAVNPQEQGADQAPTSKEASLSETKEATPEPSPPNTPKSS